MSLGIAVIGAGLMGSEHARRLEREIKGAHLAVLSDVDEVRARGVIDRLDSEAAYENSAEDAIARADVDAVLIAAPDRFHAPLTAVALRAGKPVLCEKPLAPSATEAYGIVKLESELVQAGMTARVSVGFMRRFDPSCVEMRQALRSGAIGEPLMAHCVHRNVWAYPGGSEHTINASAVHEFDFLPWLLDSRIESASWLAGRSTHHTERRDPQLVILESADGVLITLEMFVAAQYGYEVRCELVGEEGTAELRDQSMIALRRARTQSTPFPEDSMLKYALAYRAELTAWISSLHSSGMRPEDFGLANAWDGYTAAAVAEAVITSMHASDGRRVSVNYNRPVPSLYSSPVGGAV